jgi:hypothetical protein
VNFLNQTKATFLAHIMQIFSGVVFTLKHPINHEIRVYFEEADTKVIERHKKALCSSISSTLLARQNLHAECKTLDQIESRRDRNILIIRLFRGEIERYLRRVCKSRLSRLPREKHTYEFIRAPRMNALLCALTVESIIL